MYAFVFSVSNTKGPSTPAVVGHVIMPKFIVNLFCIHITSGMKHRVDVEYELDKRWLESKMCNSAVNTISGIFIKSTKFLDLREIRKMLRKTPPSPLYIILQGVTQI